MIEIVKEKYFWEIKLNRPELHNAFNPEMISAITEFFIDASKNSEIRYIYLTGNGKSFCAGADLNWMKSMAQYSKAENAKDAKVLFDMFDSMSNCPVPIVSKVQGNVYGGGIGLVAASDIVAAEKNTKFCFSEVKWGLSPATISPFVLNKMTEAKALEYMLTAKRFSAKEALKSNLIHYVSDESDVEDYLSSIKESLVENGPQALRFTKRLVNEQKYWTEDQIKMKTANIIAECRVGEEGQAGLNYFLTKEIPSWKPSEK
ncbi:MAG: enoyl-CoA hydratase-related protein [Bdellovibrionales bacterium]